VSERSNRALLEPRYKALGFEPDFALVTDFEAWKREFAQAQEEADVVYLPTNGAIRGWNEEEAKAWVAVQIRKPVITCDDFMMAYCAFGLTKVAREQGEWAARTALRILAGEAPARIPATRNTQTKCYVNPALAARIRFQAPARLACTEVR
jgi:ABC-type uncharacterized transport system substrate-binding protein